MGSAHTKIEANSSNSTPRKYTSRECRAADSELSIQGKSWRPSKSLCRAKILIVGPLPPAVGGITEFIQSISESELKKKYKLMLFGTERPTFRIRRETRHPNLFFRIGSKHAAKSIIWTISHMMKFPFVLVMNHPDIIHIHTASYWSFWENVIYSLMSRILRKKVIMHIHGGLFLEFYGKSSVVTRFLIRKALVVPDKIIVLSQSWKDLFINAGIAQLDKIIAVQNFVDASKFFHSDREMNSSQKLVKALFVGGIMAQAKGLYVILKAIPIVTREFRNIVFNLIACSGVHVPQSIRNEPSSSLRVNFLDYVFNDRKAKIFANSDMFLLPSYSEGFPITMLEAMASGLPVIATPVGAIPEVVEEGKNGFLVNVADHHELAEKILLLARNKKLREKIAMNNIKKIKDEYDIKVAEKRLDGLYSELLGNQNLEGETIR